MFKKYIRHYHTKVNVTLHYQIMKIIGIKIGYNVDFQSDQNMKLQRCSEITRKYLVKICMYKDIPI